MSNAPLSEPGSFAEWLRVERDADGLVLRDVAEGTGLDLTLLCRLESGDRLPTEEQVDALARFFKADAATAHALRIAGQFRRKYADHPAAHEAILRLAEEEGIYHAKKRETRESTISGREKTANERQ